MSINNSYVPNAQGVILYNGERIVIFCDGCELALKPQVKNDIFHGTKKGRVYLTSHRVVFTTKNNSDALKSFSMPFNSMKNVDIKQPVFGANRVEGNVSADPDGGFQGVVEFSLTFTNGGAIEFGQTLLELGKRACRNRGQPPPPPYPGFTCTGTASAAQNYYAAPPPAYAPAYQDPY